LDATAAASERSGESTLTSTMPAFRGRQDCCNPPAHRPASVQAPGAG
jgi:hypothetical protein